ncbi:MAG: hypothetical protein ABIJ85_01220 [bacterium]
MKDFFKALEVLLKKLEGIDFALLGTFNLFLQGIKIEPHDLDLITDNKGIRKIAGIFRSKITKNDSYMV